MAHKLTTCTFCGVGCGLYLETSGDYIVGAYPSVSHPTNRGRICLRGWNVHEVSSSPARLRTPLLRKEGVLQPVAWEEAFDFLALRLKEIRDQHGPDALAFLSSPRCSNEEAYLLQKFARAVIGTNNVGHGTGVYGHNSIDVLLNMIGAPASTNSVGELERSETIIVDGVDLHRQLPTVGGAVIRAKLNGAKLIAIGYRLNRVARNADLFLRLKPGTEALLYGAMAKVIVDRGLMNLPFIRARCGRYEEFLATVNGCDLLTAAENCGVPSEEIEAAALAYAQSRTAMIIYSTVKEAHAAAGVEAIVNLALLTGNIGREGAGILALTEHNNSLGVCDVGMLPDRLPGYAALADENARQKMERVWGVAPPAAPGADSHSLLADRGHGKVRGIWLCRYDPVSTAFLDDAANTLGQCDLVVVQHLFLTETAKFAHLVLPTAAFGEERVTFTNAERRIQLAEQVIDPPPGVLPAWQQVLRLAQAMGANWHYDSTDDIMKEIAEVVPFYSGVHYANLAREYGRQWPCTLDHPLGTRYLFAPGESSVEFKFAPIVRRTPDLATSKEFPMALVFGHSLYYWHRNVLIQHSESLRREHRTLLLDYPDGFVEINPEDAKQYRIRDGERVRLRASSGASLVAARITPEVRRGTVFVPYFVAQVQRQIRGTLGNGVLWIPVTVEKEAA